MAKFRYVDPEALQKDPFAGENGQTSEFEQMLAGETEWVSNRRYRMGEPVKGVVISVGQEFVFIDLGGKSNAAIAIDEFRTGGVLAIPRPGEEVSAFVREDNGSELILTRTLKRSETDDIMLREAFDKQLPIEAKVEKVNKGGFDVAVGQRRGFVPMGNMDLVPITEPETYVGSVFKFLITNFSSRNLVLSRRSLLREEQEEKVRELLGTLEVGQQKRATITRIATFGAFADIGGVEGLIPLGELAWKRVKSVEEVVKPGDTVQVKIIRIEHSPKLKIGLSLKDAGEDPWVSNATRLVPGSVIDGTVTRLADFGAFVAVDAGIEGLIHVSQLTWEKRIGHPSEVVKEGEKVSVHVLAMDIEGRKLSLSLKGPMPSDMEKRLDAKRRGRQELSAEDQELAKEWDSYRKMMEKSPVANQKREDVSALAAAFSKARVRR